MKRVLFRPQARQDLAEARAWYAEQQAGLDEQLRDRLRTVLARIAEFPSLYARAPASQVRRAPAIGPFPYSVYYRERGEAIEVLAILHNTRHPKTWQRRSR